MILKYLKKIFKKKEDDILYLTEEVKFDNVTNLKVEGEKTFNKKDTKQTKSTLTFGK